MNIMRNLVGSLLLMTAATWTVTYAEAMAESTTAPTCGSEHGKRLGSKAFVIPGIGAENTVEVGQTMVSTFKTDLMDGTVSYEFALDQPVRLTGRSYGQGYALTLGPLKVKMIQGVSYRPGDYTFQYSNDGSPRTGLSKPDVLLTMSLPSREVVASTKIGFGDEKLVAGTAALVTTPQCTLTGPESFQRELVYSGVAKGVITILYREFLGGVARPAFSQEVHFDLSEGSEIGYKGARFKVLKANNVGITYTVTKGLD
jgi:hypothetical protein